MEKLTFLMLTTALGLGGTTAAAFSKLDSSYQMSSKVVFTGALYQISCDSDDRGFVALMPYACKN